MRTFVAILIGLLTATAGVALEPVSGTRDKAIRECNAVANRFKQRTWGAMEHHQYRTCMKRRDEKE